jgi:hypothetical protein
MGEWVVVILLACVSSNGISENKEVGFGVNPKGEIIIISPPGLDVHLKLKRKMEDVVLMSDDNDHLYSIRSSVIEGKFILFLNELEPVKLRLHGMGGGIELETYKSLSSTVITTADPQANSLFEGTLSMDGTPR